MGGIVAMVFLLNFVLVAFARQRESGPAVDPARALVRTRPQTVGDLRLWQEA
jgi:hypothetical protein